MLIRTKKQEQIGEIYMFTETAIYALFPIVINYSSKVMPPILFAGLTALIAGIFFFFYLLFTKNLKKILNKKALIYILAVTFFIIIVPSLFIFPGTKLTTGTNTAILMQTEIFFALIICGLFFKEKITKNKVIGSLAILIGAIAVLYNGEFKLNTGDILIVTGVIFYPIGNFYAKKALKLVPSSVIIFIRSLLGGIILITVSIIFEKSLSTIIPSTKANLFYILSTGIVVMAISKILWYEGLKRLDITKATAIAMSYPALSLIFAIIFLKEIPTFYQISGLIIIMLGVFFITRKKFPTKKSSPSISA